MDGFTQEPASIVNMKLTVNCSHNGRILQRAPYPSVGAGERDSVTHQRLIPWQRSSVHGTPLQP